MYTFANGFVGEFVDALRHNLWRAIVLCVCAVVGVVLGVVLFGLPSATWWQYNRMEFACTLLNGGFFKILFAALLPCLLVALVAVLGCMQYFLRAAVYVTSVLCGVYCGALVCALANYSFVAGVLYGLLYCLVQCLSELGLLFWCVVQPDCSQTFAEALCSCKKPLVAYFCLFLVKILLIFVLLRPIYGLI